MTANKKLIAEFNKEILAGNLKSVCEEFYPAIGGYTAEFFRNIKTYDGGWLLATDSTGPNSCIDYAFPISEKDVNLAYGIECDPYNKAVYTQALLDLSDSIRANLAETRGRPPTLAGGKKVTLYLDTASLDSAATLGNGNVSEGIRLALQD